MSQSDKSWVLKLLLCTSIVVSSADVTVIVIAIVAQIEGSCRHGFFPLPLWLIIACCVNIVTLAALLLCIVRVLRLESETAMRHGMITNVVVGIAKGAWLIVGIVVVSETSGCTGLNVLSIVELIWLGAATIGNGCALRYSSLSYDSIE